MNNESTPFWRMAEFWIIVVDVVTNIVMLLLNEFAPGRAVEIVQQIIIWIQPLIALIIASMLGTRAAAALRKITTDALSEFVAKVYEVRGD